MFVWLVLKDAAVIVVFWNCTKITFLILTADSCSVFVFLILEALHETAVFMIKFTMFKLILKEQFFINEHVDLHWWDYIHYQSCHCFVEFDDFLELLCVQNLNFFFEMFILFHELLYCFFLLDAVKSSNLHFMHHNWKSFLIDLHYLAHYYQSAVILLQLHLHLLQIDCYHNVSAE